MIKSKLRTFLPALFFCAFTLASCASQPYHESTGQFIDSSIITTKVKARLVEDKTIQSLPITVKTYKSTVQLSGFVNNNYQRKRAELDASGVEGVTHVQNLLVVKSQ